MIERKRFFARLAGVTANLSPTWVAFVGSCLLSLIAITNHTTLNRDGMLYVYTARIVLQDGLAAAHDGYSWPFLPMLMAAVARLSGLDPEIGGHLLNTLFMAGACALAVASSRQLYPEASWPICLAVLAIPGLNEYRNELLREYGCWFFVMLSLWLALRWADAPRWRTAILPQITLCIAALFRPEALAVLIALPFWQAFEAPATERWRRMTMLGLLPAIGILTMFALFASELLPARLYSDLTRLSIDRFHAKALAIAPALFESARDNAATILFYGSLAVIPLKFVKAMGVFFIPLLHPVFAGTSFSAALSRMRVFTWAFIAHVLVLAVFVMDMQFLAGRYVATLALLAAPLAGYGVHLLFLRFPNWRTSLICIAVLVALANVVVTSTGKQHFIDAGHWLATHAQESPRVYNESLRAAYYAGWRYTGKVATRDRPELPKALERREFDLVILEVSRGDADFQKWLTETRLREIQRFGHPDNDAIVIAVPEHIASPLPER